MKCPNCGYEESRPDARFCKKCGQPMAAQPAPPVAAAPSPPLACPHCGSPVKPGARFCPRCGKAVTAAAPVAGPPPAPVSPPPGGYVPPPAQPLPVTQPSMQAAQPPAAYSPAQPSMAAGQQYATPPSSPPPVAASGQPYTTPPSFPPPPIAPGAAPLPGEPAAPAAGRPAAKKTGVPKWLWIVGGGVLLVCLIAAVVLAVVFRDSWLPQSGAAEPSPTPTEQAPVIPPSATASPPLEPTATATLPVTDLPPTPQIDVHLIPSVTELEANELLEVTVSLTNTGTVEITSIRYELIELNPAVLRSDQPLTIDHPNPVPPGGSDQAWFLLRAVASGTTPMRVRVTTVPSLPEDFTSEPVEVTVR